KGRPGRRCETAYGCAPLFRRMGQMFWCRAVRVITMGRSRRRGGRLVRDARSNLPAIPAAAGTMARVNPEGRRPTSICALRQRRGRCRIAPAIVMAAASAVAAGMYADPVASPLATTIGQSGDAVLDFAY